MCRAHSGALSNCLSSIHFNDMTFSSYNFQNTIMILSFQTDRPGQTV